MDPLARKAGQIVWMIGQREHKAAGWRAFKRVRDAAAVGVEGAIVVRMYIANIANQLMQRGIGWLF